MRYALLTVLPLALVLSACGNDSGQQAAAPVTPEASTEPASAAGSNEPTSAASSVAVTEAAAPMVASESTAAPIADDEVIYDPIDISKLQSTWWQQFSK